MNSTISILQCVQLIFNELSKQYVKMSVEGRLVTKDIFQLLNITANKYAHNEISYDEFETVIKDSCRELVIFVNISAVDPHLASVMVSFCPIPIIMDLKYFNLSKTEDLNTFLSVLKCREFNDIGTTYIVGFDIWTYNAGTRLKYARMYGYEHLFMTHFPTEYQFEMENSHISNNNSQNDIIKDYKKEIMDMLNDEKFIGHLAKDSIPRLLNDSCDEYYRGNVPYDALERLIKQQCQKLVIYADIRLVSESEKIVIILFTRTQNSFDLSKCNDLNKILSILKTREFFDEQFSIKYHVST